MARYDAGKDGACKWEPEKLQASPFSHAHLGELVSKWPRAKRQLKNSFSKPLHTVRASLDRNIPYPAAIGSHNGLHTTRRSETPSNGVDSIRSHGVSLTR
jgi:hypothetical protein